jgi:chromosome segregation ATPase
VQDSVADLQARVQQLDETRPAIEAAQKDVERVVGGMEAVAARRQSLEEMQTRLAEVSALAAQLDDRTKTFRTRLDVAEGRFVTVTRLADEAEHIASLIATVAGTVGKADARVAELTRSITSLEESSQELRSTAERAERLGRELAQRQDGLDKASEHLARASALRQEAAGAVQQLDERTRALQASIGDVESRTKRLADLSDELERCSGKVRSVEKGMGQFEEHLGRWEMAKADLHRSLEQVAARQATVDALQTNIGQMFELAERTANDLRATVEAQREIRDSKASLDDVLRRLHETDAAAAGLDQRKQEIEDAERRLARAEALLIDIQSSLEMLNSQKATLDHVIEQAGSLSFQVQQAEGLIERLRKERDITNAVRTALEDAGTRSPRLKRD